MVLEALENDYITNYIVEIHDIANTDISINKIHNLAVEYSNLYFDFYQFSDFRLFAKQYTERKYMYHFPVNTYMDVQYLLSFPGLAAITIEEPLTFEIDQIHKTIKEDEERDIQIRVWPTIGKPNRYKDYTNDNGINHFWILPQHIHLYEDLIDVIELLDKNERREHALCIIYLSETPYYLSLNPLIKSIDSEMVGNFVDEEWAQRRLNCRQTCLRGSNNCRYCIRESEMFDMLVKNPDLIRKHLQDPNVNMLIKPDQALYINEDIEESD